MYFNKIKLLIINKLLFRLYMLAHTVFVAADFIYNKNNQCHNRLNILLFV